ncbi:hypothetical protein J7E71_13180 [Mesobacillus foraminis]|nr:hypothetical protein [Mesobacillus foraminis]MBT2756897.1 hypothetical protein [Mesobacillus foraminis]
MTAGTIELAGQNFVLLTANKREIVIPYDRICQIKPKDGFADDVLMYLG